MSFTSEQIDLQSSSREKERLAEQVQTLQSLRRDEGNSQQGEQQSGTDEDLKVGTVMSSRSVTSGCVSLPTKRLLCHPPQKLASWLQERGAGSAAEREELKNSGRREDLQEEELKELRKELESVVLSCGQAQQKSREREVKSLSDVPVCTKNRDTKCR